MDRIDPKRDFGNFTVITQSGTRYGLAVRRNKVTGAIGLTSPRPEHCISPAFIHSRSGEGIVVGAPMEVTKTGGIHSYITSPVTAIERVGIERLDAAQNEGEYTVTTENDNVFTLLVSTEATLIQHVTLFPDCPEVSVGHTPNIWGVIEAGKPLIVLPRPGARSRTYSRIVTIIPSE